jgi:hypothetical protein
MCSRVTHHIEVLFNSSHDMNSLKILFIITLFIQAINLCSGFVEVKIRKGVSDISISLLYNGSSDDKISNVEAHQIPNPILKVIRNMILRMLLHGNLLVISKISGVNESNIESLL